MVVVVSALVAAAPYVPASSPQPRPEPTVCARPIGQGWAIVSSGDVEGGAASSVPDSAALACR